MYLLRHLLGSPEIFPRRLLEKITTSGPAILSTWMTQGHAMFLMRLEDTLQVVPTAPQTLR